MKKRFVSTMLVLLILITAVSVGTFSANAASELKTSDACIEILKGEEGFIKYPYWDYAQYTIGYGTRCPDEDLERYRKEGITEEEAEALLRNYLVRAEAEINKFADTNGLTLSQNQFDALMLFTYNCGSSWCYSTGGNLFKAVVKGATGSDFIRAMTLWCNAGGQIQKHLVRRRLVEANLYLNGVYSRATPENFAYVMYDPNGGTVSYKIQGYDVTETPAPHWTPTYTGFQFDGWYTALNGGTKVTALDASLKATTLYARWKTASGEVVETPETSVNITVTSNKVNVRKGPGTNYAVVGQVSKGDKLVITETATGTGYTWGKFEKGWVALQYTDYDTVIREQPSTPETPETPEPPSETTPPEPTESSTPETPEPPSETTPLEPTEPSTPETTEPPVTEPPVTEPPAETTPPQPETDTVLKGTVKVSSVLRIRSGPGANYSIVGSLSNGKKVEITETKEVGSVTWGKISSGWISLQYVVLDSTGTNPSGGNNSENNQGTTPSTGSQKVTGTVNVGSVLRIRSGPGTSYVVTGYLNPKAKVEILEQQTVGSTVWGKVSKGWISMDYVVLDNQNSSDQGSSNQSSPGTTQTTTKTVTASCLRIRSNAGTSYSIVGYLYTGAKVEILETATVNGTKWGRISKGWISMDYVK